MPADASSPQQANNLPARVRPQVRYWIPEGYVTAEGLRADIRALARRGFGAIELVAVNFFKTPMPDEARWGTPRYYEAVRVVLCEAHALGLAVDIANGPGWPISVPHISDANDPATLFELTYGVAHVQLPAHGTLALPERRVTHEEGTPQLVAVCAYRLVGDKILDEHSYVDLLPFTHGNEIQAWPDSSSDTSATWAIFAFYAQPACHKVLNQHFVIDHLSREGALASVAWWEHELLPALGDEAAYLRSFFCDSLEYRVSMEWTRDFAQAFERRHGYSLLPYLPVVGEPATYPKNDVPGYTFANGELTRAVRHDYLETLSWMFTTRHLGTLCAEAARLGKSIRYQVAYNKPFCEEDAAAAIDLPENESLGRQSLDNLRVMAGAAHLTRKPRYSFEAAAEFGSGYGQTQRDMLWWLKRAAIAGCNAQVFHGAAYCGHGMDNVSWPGWEAWDRLCSNNWGRTLSERSLAQMNAAIARINALRREQPLVDLAFVREAYLNHGHGTDGAHNVLDAGLLNANGFSYEFLSPSLLAHENARVENARLDTQGASYKALVLAEQSAVCTATLERLAQLARDGMPVFVVGRAQLKPYSTADLHNREAWQQACDDLLACRNTMVVQSYPALLTALGWEGITPDAQHEASHLFSAHLRRHTGAGATEDFYLLYNGNNVRTSVDGKADPESFMPGVLHSGALRSCDRPISLSGTGDPYLLDLASGREYALHSIPVRGRIRLVLPLEPDQLVAVGLRDNTSTLSRWPLHMPREYEVLTGWTLSLHELQPSTDPLDFLAGGYRHIASFGPLDTLSWWDELPEVPENFAGYGEYRTSFTLDTLANQIFLRLPQWNDALELELNGVPLPVVAGLGSLIDLRDALQLGTNELVIRVFSNLSNRLDGASRARFHQSAQHYGLNGIVELILATES